MKQNNWHFIRFLGALLILISLEVITLFILGPIGFFQDMRDMEGVAYFLTKFLPYFRIGLLVLTVWTGFYVFKQHKRYRKIIGGILCALYIGIFYVSNFQLKADKLFSDLKTALYLPASESKVPTDATIIGVSQNGKAKAYPLVYIAYHHKVLDSVGNKPILVTYCIWTRTGRVFDPVVDGQLQDFDLVGLGRYNAILKDRSSNSWWQQATGEAIVGKHKRDKLNEVFSEQMTLESWIEKYPNTLVLQPDSMFVEEYDHNSKYVARFCEEDNGQALDPWEERSWVIGVTHGTSAAAFDFLYLREYNMIEDSVGALPVLVALESDGVNYHIWDRRINGEVLSFEYNRDSNYLTEIWTKSIWNMNGKCISGSMEGEQLKPVQGSEEYWYSWGNFYPNTKKR